MTSNLSEINRRFATNPAAFVAECDERYERNVLTTANRVAGRISQSRIVLLSGPSGSGKTTTAQNIEARLERMGIETHTVSMDNYYLDVNENTPRNERGEFDFESPECLDLPLLRKHFELLDAGEEVLIPFFDFHNQRRDELRSTPLRLGANEMVIFEGIHALNGALGDAAHATKVYISARSNVENGGKTVFKGTWSRILRRAIRDGFFRGASAATTFKMWENLRKGEKRYISPYKNTADITFNTSFGYEIAVLKNFAQNIFDEITPDFDRYAELMQLKDALALFDPLDPGVLPERSMLREFIGEAGLK